MFTVRTEPWRRNTCVRPQGSHAKLVCPAGPDQGWQTATSRRTQRVECVRSSPEAHRAPTSGTAGAWRRSQQRGDRATRPPRGGHLRPPAPLRGVRGSSPLQTSCPSRLPAGSRGSPARGPGGGRAERGPSVQAPGHRHLQPTRPFHRLKTWQARPLAPRPQSSMRLEDWRPLPARRREDG